MKKISLAVMFLLISLTNADAMYTYIFGPGQYITPGTLNGDESILVTGGWGDRLTLSGYSLGRIESTSPLGYLSGGIWEMIVGSYSSAVVTGGEFHALYVASYGTLTISGGRVDSLWGMLYDLPAVPEAKHIQFICKSWDYNVSMKLLTGLWGNNDPFSIALADTAGYPGTFDSINFIIVPEPLTLALLAFGGLFVRRSAYR